MVEKGAFGLGPVSAAFAGGGAQAGAPAPDPAAFLARLMDLRGSVELAQRLAALDRPRARGGGSEAARRELSRVVAERADAITGEVAATFANPFQRRNKLPSAEEAVRLLVDGGALIDRRGKAAASAGEALWAPAHDLLSRSLDRARFELGTLREEIGPDLPALGPAVERLGKLDAALFAATAKGRRELEDRLLAGVGRRFAEDFAAAVAALPGATAPAHLAPWFAPRGLYREALLRGRDLVLGVIRHERRRIEAILEARGDEG